MSSKIIPFIFIVAKSREMTQQTAIFYFDSRNKYEITFGHKNILQSICLNSFFHPNTLVQTAQRNKFVDSSIIELQLA